MSFKKYLKEIEDVTVFPTDEQIEAVAKSADEAFWKIVVESFKDKLESEEFIPSKQSATFKEQQKLAIKEWLKSNWPEPKDANKDKPKVSEFKGGVVKFEQPKTTSSGAGSEPATGTATTSTPEARI